MPVEHKHLMSPYGGDLIGGSGLSLQEKFEQDAATSGAVMVNQPITECPKMFRYDPTLFRYWVRARYKAFGFRAFD